MAQSSESKWVYLRASKTGEVWAIRKEARKGLGWEKWLVYLRASKTGEVWVMRKEARKETTEKKKAIHSETRLVMTLEKWWERWCYWVYKGLEKLLYKVYKLIGRTHTLRRRRPIMEYNRTKTHGPENSLLKRHRWLGCSRCPRHAQTQPGHRTRHILLSPSVQITRTHHSTSGSLSQPL